MPSDHSAGKIGEWKRCKMCLNDPEKRVSEAERFCDLNGPEDYATVLRHALEEHIDSDELSEVMAGRTLPTPCGDCGEPFVSEVHISDGLRVRSYCDECAESDPGFRRTLVGLKRSLDHAPVWGRKRVSHKGGIANKSTPGLSLRFRPRRSTVLHIVEVSHNFVSRCPRSPSLTPYDRAGWSKPTLTSRGHLPPRPDGASEIGT